MRITSAEKYEAIFREEEQGAWVNVKGVWLQRTKTIKAGPMLEVECFPIWAGKPEQVEKAVKTAATKKAQEDLNDRNAKKKLTRLANENFGKQDLYIGVTYDRANEPADDERAYKDIKNWIGRVKRMRSRAGLPELKYIYITEKQEKANGATRYHHHVLMSGDGMDRDAVESLWTLGTCNSRRYQEQDKHMTGIAMYMNKRKENQKKAMGRRWGCSKNLRPPKITVANHKISKWQAAQLARDAENGAKALFERKYPGYQFIDCHVKRSDYAPGAYVYVTMRRWSDNAGKTTSANGKRGNAMPDAVGDDAKRKVAGITAAVPRAQRRAKE